MLLLWDGGRQFYQQHSWTQCHHHLHLHHLHLHHLHQHFKHNTQSGECNPQQRHTIAQPQIQPRLSPSETKLGCNNTTTTHGAYSFIPFETNSIPGNWSGHCGGPCHRLALDLQHNNPSSSSYTCEILLSGFSPGLHELEAMVEGLLRVLEQQHTEAKHLQQVCHDTLQHIEHSNKPKLWWLQMDELHHKLVHDGDECCASHPSHPTHCCFCTFFFKLSIELLVVQIWSIAPKFWNKLILIWSMFNKQRVLVWICRKK